MAADLMEAIRAALRASGRPLTSSELAARLRRPHAEVEAALVALGPTPELVVGEWPVGDPHFGLDRVVVATWVGEADEAARQTALACCRQVYDDLLRDFLASHRCV
ncbi:MAG: hypothetical protein IRZ14_16530 [Chloroflexi bacterium]|nr:hypothetical protein [Chloroflexota bacterium]